MQRILRPCFTLGLLLAACGPGQPAPTVATPTAARAPTQVRAIPTAENARASILSVQGARPGGQASVTVQTTPEALCRAQYTEPLGLIVNAPGLGMNTSDDEGKVTFVWPIRSESRLGPGKLRVNCNGAEATADVPIG